MVELRCDATRRSRLACLIGMFVLGLLALAPAAGAQDGGPYEDSIRRALIEFDQGHWEESRALFRQAHGLNPNARTWRGMGICAFELRQYGAAIDELNAARGDSQKPLTLDQRNEVLKLVGRARTFVALYEVKIKPENAQILVDGAPAKVNNRKLYLDPGSHILTLRAAGHQERQ